MPNFAEFFKFYDMGKFSDYNLPLKSLSDGRHEVNMHLGLPFFTNMENTDVHGADLDVKVTIDAANGRYAILFEITGEVVLICDRCLDDLHYPIDASYRIMVEYGDDYNDESDDLLVIPNSDATLNVAYMIYDTVVLAIPIKHVHPMGKCNRQMSAILRKHRAHPQGEDAELEETLIDEMDGMDGDAPTDPRWDGLKGASVDED